MAADKNSVALVNFFNGFFHNFPRLILTNLLFAVPFAVFFCIFWLINTLTGLNRMFILLLAVIPIFPFYAGVVQVTSHMVRGEENVDVFQNFISGIKSNFLRFLIHGIVFYAAVIFSYYSIVVYLEFGSQSNVLYVLMGITIFISVFLLFAFFYIPPMTVTFDLSMKHIYKNSALMTFGEIKHNIIALFGLIILAFACATILFCCTVPIAVIIATVILAVVFIPSIMSYIINSAVYKPMYSMIVDKSKKINRIDEKIENRRQGIFYDDEEEEKPNYAEEFASVDIDESGNMEEYIYFNGKMVKRGVLLRMKKEAMEKKEDK